MAGAAVDITLVNGYGDPLDMGTLVDATPEESGGRCYFDAVDISPQARRNRDLLAGALSSAGLVNYPTEWWLWSYGDRYWALLTGGPAALYGPVEDLDDPDLLGASYGDAYLAAVAVGTVPAGAIAAWNPVAATVHPERVAAYDRQYPLWQRLYQATKDISAELGGDA